MPNLIKNEFIIIGELVKKIQILHRRVHTNAFAGKDRNGCGVNPLVDRRMLR